MNNQDSSHLLTPKQPFISICILNYNGQKFIKPCFSSVRKLDYPKDRFEVVFVDNASQDDSVLYVRQNYPEARVVVNDRNYGFARGNNLGLKACQGQYVVFLNNDTVVDPDWLNKLAAGIDDFPEAKFFGSKIYVQGRDNILNSAAFNISPIGSGYDRGLGRPDNEEFSQSSYVPGVSGAALMVNKVYFEKIGGFDEDYFMYFEDVDLCLRSWLHGKKCAYIADSKVYHAVGGTAGRHRNNFRLYYATRNRLFTLFKNFTVKHIIKGFIISLVFDFFVALLAIMHGNFTGPLIIIKAHLVFWVGFPKVMAKRRVIQKNKIYNTDNLTKMGVIETLFKSMAEYLNVIKKT